MAGKLGIVAGQGPLPRMIIDACRDRGREVFLIVVEGETDPETAVDVPHVWRPVGGIGHQRQRVRAFVPSKGGRMGGAQIGHQPRAFRVARPVSTGVSPSASTVTSLAFGAWVVSSTALFGAQTSQMPQA